MWGWILNIGGMIIGKGDLIKTFLSGRTGALLLALIIAGVSGVLGWKINGWRWESKQAQALQSLIDQHMIEIELKDKTQEKLLSEKKKIEVKERGVEKEIIKYIKTPRAAESCFNDDELRLYNGDTD